MDRWIVTLQAVVPLHVIGAQAERAGERGGDERVRVIGAKARDVGERDDVMNIAGRTAAGNPALGATPQVGGRYEAARSGYTGVANASPRVIGRLPQRLRVAKSSSRSM